MNKLHQRRCDAFITMEEDGLVTGRVGIVQRKGSHALGQSSGAATTPLLLSMISHSQKTAQQFAYQVNIRFK